MSGRWRWTVSVSTPALQAVDGSCKRSSNEIVPAEANSDPLGTSYCRRWWARAWTATPEKHSLPQDVRDTFRRLQSFGNSAGWSVESHVKLLLFTIEDVKQNLFFSPDKGLCISIYWKRTGQNHWDQSWRGTSQYCGACTMKSSLYPSPLILAITLAIGVKRE